MSEVNGPTKEEMSFPLGPRLRELDLWVRQELENSESKRVLGSNIDILLGFTKVKFGRFARQVGCDPSHITRVRQGKAVPSFSLLNTLARVLGTNAEVLLKVDLAERFKKILDECNSQ